VTPSLHLGHTQGHLPRTLAASAEAQRASCITQLYSSHSSHLSYSVCIYSGGGGSGRRFATLGDDSDDGDDEPQNYFAGGERR